MAQVETTGALLVMALQDLLDGEAALIERLPTVAEAARDTALKALIEADRARSEARHERLSAILIKLDETPGGSENIWLRAILEDAANDAETIAAGHLRDIALTGALRKGKQSERVSYETALALAERLGLDEAAGALRRCRDAEQSGDDDLAGVLASLVKALEDDGAGT